MGTPGSGRIRSAPPASSVLCLSPQKFSKFSKFSKFDAGPAACTAVVGECRPSGACTLYLSLSGARERRGRR